MLLVRLPDPSWHWVDRHWTIDTRKDDHNPDGWCYGFNFDGVGRRRRTCVHSIAVSCLHFSLFSLPISVSLTLSLPPYQNPKCREPTMFDCTRWRRWVRRRQQRPPGPVPPALPEEAAAPRMSPDDALATAWSGYGPDETGMEPPSYLCCPISFELLEEPVLTSAGHTFERAEIERIIDADGHDPFTRAPISRDDLIPNLALASAVAVWHDFFATGESGPLQLSPTTDPSNLEARTVARAAEDAHARLGGGYWQCPLCTFLNTGHDPSCRVCTSDRGDAPWMDPEAAAHLLGETSPGQAPGLLRAVSRGRSAGRRALSASSRPRSLSDIGRALLRIGTSPAETAPHGVPQWLCCAMTGQGPMREPVTTRSGWTYEQESLARFWQETGRAIDPVTQEALQGDESTLAVPNFCLREACDEFRQRMKAWQSARGTLDELSPNDKEESEAAGSNSSVSPPALTRQGSKDSTRVTKDGWVLV